MADSKGHVRGRLLEGELEIGQIASMLNDLPTAGEVVKTIVEDCRELGAASLGKRFEF